MPRRLRRGESLPADNIRALIIDHSSAAGVLPTEARRIYNRIAALLDQGHTLFEVRRVLAWSLADWQEQVIHTDPFAVLRPSKFRQNLVLAERGKV